MDLIIRKEEKISLKYLLNAEFKVKVGLSKYGHIFTRLRNAIIKICEMIGISYAKCEMSIFNVIVTTELSTMWNNKANNCFSFFFWNYNYYFVDLPSQFIMISSKHYKEHHNKYKMWISCLFSWHWVSRKVNLYPDLDIIERVPGYFWQAYSKCVCLLFKIKKIWWRFPSYLNTSDDALGN